jgi:hypothetical protein
MCACICTAVLKDLTKPHVCVTLPIVMTIGCYNGTMLQVDFASTMNTATLSGFEDHVMCMQALEQQSIIAKLKGRLELAYDQYEQQQVCIGI